MTDAIDRAANAQPRARTLVFFGELDYDIWDCVLQRGAGKIPFDKEQHKEEDLRTAIQMSVIPLAGSPIKNNVDREMIAESDEWAKVVLPSLRAINADLRQLKRRFVQVKLVPTGRTYKNAAGEEKEASTFEFLAVFNSEADCRAAADAFFKPSGTAAPAAPRVAPQTQQTQAQQGDAKRTLALKFVPKLWQQAGQDVDKFEALLKANALTSQLNISDDDVVGLLSVDASQLVASA